MLRTSTLTVKCRTHIRQGSPRTHTRQIPMYRPRIPIANDNNTLSPSRAPHYIQFTNSKTKPRQPRQLTASTGPKPIFQSNPAQRTLLPRPQPHLPIPLPSENLSTQLTAKEVAFHRWHFIFKYIHPKTLQKMAKEEILPLPAVIRSNLPKLNCLGFAQVKRRPKPHPRTPHTYHVGVALSFDVCRLISSHQSRHHYILVSADTTTRYTFAPFSATRRDVILTLLAVL